MERLVAMSESTDLPKAAPHATNPSMVALCASRAGATAVDKAVALFSIGTPGPGAP